MKVGVKKLLSAGMMPARTCSGDVSARKVKKMRRPMAQKHTALSFPPWLLSTGQKEFGLENGGVTKEERVGGKFKRDA